jgi:8-oxo-dGTP pyrophosphatase MutT (NUDIX family)
MQKSVKPMLHPRLDDRGKPFLIQKPSCASGLEAWWDLNATACVVPDGPMPDEINGISVEQWSEAPATEAGWEALASRHQIAEPDFVVPSGYKPAAGTVIRESDRRIWLVAPSNAFGGYQATFPKGTMEGRTAQATALIETFEETGLRVRLVKHLMDVKRSQSYTRYYLAERVGGSPADMGWESQAVMLAPLHELGSLLNSPHDAPILNRLMSAA